MTTSARLEGLDHDRPRLRRDAPREAARERHLHALTDLLLQAARRARDEHVAILVEQQHGRRVDGEVRSDALEQLGEHVLERHVPELRIADRLRRLL